MRWRAFGDEKEFRRELISNKPEKVTFLPSLDLTKILTASDFLNSYDLRLILVQFTLVMSNIACKLVSRKFNVN